MFPDLSYFFNAVFGTDVDNWTSIFKTFGVFLALSFVGAYWVLASELRRKEKEGLVDRIPMKQVSAGSVAIREALINGFVAFFIGFKIPYIYRNFDAFKLDPAGVVFSMKGEVSMGILAGILIALYYYMSAKNKTEAAQEKNYYMHPFQKAGDILMVAAISGIIGSRLFSVLENFGDFMKDPLGQLFSGSGLTVYGGLILGFICVYLYVKKLNIKPVYIMDITGLCFPLAYAIGRMGCQFAGDGDWGIVNAAKKPDWFVLPDWVWSYDYPHNVLMEGTKIKDCVGLYCNKLTEGVYPTPIYEIFGSLLLFFILWSNRSKFKKAGMLFFTFLFFNGIQRFFVEMIRVNPRYDILGFQISLSQGIGLLFTIIGIIGIIKLKSSSSNNTGGKANPDEPVNYSQIGHKV